MQKAPGLKNVSPKEGVVQMSKMNCVEARQMIGTLEALIGALELEFVVVNGSSEYHHPACVMLPLDVVQTRCSLVAVEDLQGQALEPAPCCIGLTDRHMARVMSLGREFEGLGSHEPRTGIEFLATEAGETVMRTVNDIFEDEDRSVVLEWLALNLDKSGLTLLSRPGLTRAEVMGRLAMLKVSKGQ